MGRENVPHGARFPGVPLAIRLGERRPAADLTPQLSDGGEVEKRQPRGGEPFADFAATLLHRDAADAGARDRAQNVAPTAAARKVLRVRDDFCK